MVIKRADPDKVFKKVERASERRAVDDNKGSSKAQKTAARLAAVQVLYQMKLNNQNAADAVREFMVYRVGFSIDGDVFVPAEPQLLQDIVQGIESRWMDVDAVVTAALAQGGREEVESIIDAILRCGIYELLAHGQIDAGIIINDYLSVTAGFYDGGETKLVNGILDKAAKKLRG